MNWSDIESTGSFIAGVSCGVHPVGLTKSEYRIAREIYVLQELHGSVENIASGLYILEEICPKIMMNGYCHDLTVSKNVRAQTKAAITRRITKLQKTLPQIRLQLQEEQATEKNWYPDVDWWLRARPNKESEEI